MERRPPLIPAERHPLGVYLAGKIGLTFLVLLASAGVAMKNPTGAYAPREAFYIVSLAFLVWGLSAAVMRSTRDLVRFGWLQLVFDAVLVTGLVALTTGVDSPLVVLYFINIIAAPFILPAWGVVTVFLMDVGLFASVAWAGRMGLLQWLEASHRQLRVDDVVLHVFAMALVGMLSVQLTRTMKGLLDRQVRAGEALLAERALIMRELEAGIVEADASGRITASSALAEGLLGDIIGGSLAEVLPGTGPTWEVVLPTEADPVHLLCSAHPTQSGGQMVLVQDVTRLKQMEAAVVREERLAAVGKLAAGLAHEIRNPLASLSGAIQLLKEEKAEPLHDIALREVNRLDELVEGFLDIARPPRLEIRPTDLEALAREVVASFRNDPRYRDRLEVEVQAASDLPLVPLDPARIHQVLWNLLLNAAQATPGEGAILLFLRHRPGQVELRVSDSGVGIGARHLGRIFDPFFTTRTGGTGMGLANVERILNAHGGSISVYSKQGQGTSFMLCFPVPGELAPAAGGRPGYDAGAEEVIEVDE